jgi:malonyl-CoA O-methyltransferase
LIEASRVLGQPKYAAAAQRSLDYYLQQPDLVEFTTLTHFFGYILEALVDLGHHRLAEAGLQQVVDLQEPSGLVPAQPGVRWMCTPGSAQLALVAYKLGLGAFADRALDYLQTVQEPSGGFMGSYGPGAAYGPDAEPSWACKYFLDACHWRIRARGDRQQQAPVLPEGSWAALGTAPMHLALRTALGELAGKRVLEVGCGRGERLWALRAAWPTAALCGVDNAQELLNALPPGIAGSRASTLNLPFPDGVFDAVVCTDGLAGTIRIERALTELCRVIKPGGHLVVGLDQDGPYADRMTIDARAQWFAPDDVTRVLRQYGTLVALESVELAKGSDHRVARLIWHAVRGETPVAVAVSPADLHRPVPEHPESRWDSHLPNRWAQRRALARALVEEGFTSYAGGDLAHARAAFLRAWRYDPVWLFNRGIVSIVVRSLGVPRPR